MARPKTATKVTTQGKASAKKTKVLTKKPAAVKKTSAKATAPKTTKTPVFKLTVPKKAYTQTELVSTLSEYTSIDKKSVKSLLEAIVLIAKNHLNKKGPGQYTLPGVVKLVALNKPATKSRKGRNPATGEAITIKAKPARRVVKARILKKFKTEVE